MPAPGATGSDAGGNHRRAELLTALTHSCAAACGLEQALSLGILIVLGVVTGVIAPVQPF